MLRDQKSEVEAHINSQASCPSRKAVAARFPDVPVRIIRSLIQSREDREKKAQEARKAG